MAVEIASAYVNIVPSFRGLDQALQRGFAGSGRRVGDDIAQDMRRADFEGAGRRAGGEFSDGAEGEMDAGGKKSGDGFLGGLGGMLKGGIAGIAVAAAGAFTAAYSEALDVKKARALTQAQLGVSPETAAMLGKQAGQLYANGYGESISEVNAAITTVQGALPDLFGDDLTKITGQVLSFSQAFSVDTADAVQSVNTLINSGLAKDSAEALDLLTAGFQRVPQALQGTLKDSVDEYGQYFNQLGFSGEEAFGALVDASALGEIGIDKTGDAIKEFQILATDGSKSTAGAFEAIGLNATEMSNKILAGGDEAKDATNQIVDGLLGIEDPSAQAQAALALFGTPLEDLGVGKIPQFLGALDGAGGSMADFAGSASEVDSVLGSTTSTFELMYRNIKTQVVDFFVEKVLPAVAELTMWLGEKLAPVVERVGKWFNEKLVPFLQLAWEWFEVNLLPAIQRLFEFLGSTFENFASVIGGLVDFLTGVFTGDWSKAWDGIKTIFGGIWQEIQDLLGLAWEAIVGVIENIGPTIWQWVQDIGAKLPGWGQQLLQWIWDGLQALWPKVVEWFGKLPGWLWDAVTAFVGTTGQWLIDRGFEFLGWLAAGIEAYGPTVLQWFNDLPSMLWNGLVSFVGTAGRWMIDRGSEFFGWLGQGIIDATPGIIAWVFSLPGKIWDAVGSAFSSVQEWGATLMQSMIQGLKDSGPYFVKELVNVITSAASAIGIPIDTILGISGVSVDGTIDNLIASYAKDKALATNYNRVDSSGNVVHRAEGGSVWGPGGPTSDSIPAMLSNGEFVVNAAASARNRSLLEMINADRFATGGLVGGIGKTIGASLMKKIIPLFAKNISEGLSSPTFVGNGNWGPENTSGLAANTAAARDFIMQHWGIRDIGGWSPTGSVSTSDHPKGKALDVMIANYLSAAGIAQGTSVADWFIGNPSAFGTKYVIWRDRINQGGAWSPYSHPSGNNDTLQHRDHVHISFLSGSGEFAGQQPVGDTPKDLLSGLSSAVKAKFSSLFSSSSGGGAADSGGADVDRWRSLGLDVLSKVGAYKGQNLTPFIGQMLNQIRTESSGNPNAINNTDINAQRGDPSIGLLQVIGSTFRAALKGTPFEGLIAAGQRDPRASLTASTLYSLGRYGSLDKAWRGVAYANGGIVPGNAGWGIDSVPAMLTPGEGVFTPPQTKALITHAQALEAGFSGRTPVYIDLGANPHPVVQAIGGMMADAFDEQEFELTVTGAQRP
jgi:hypothetical protein